jgi:hypothetical protein
MGYILHAFIGKQPDLHLLANAFHNSKLIHVGREMFIIPMTEELYDELNEFKISEDVGNLTYMSQHVEKRVLGIIGDRCIGYIEAEYSGGQGGQTAVLWQNGRRYKLYDFGHRVINILLKHLGVLSDLGLDEFDTINLGRHRNTEDWLNPNN